MVVEDFLPILVEDSSASPEEELFSFCWNRHRVRLGHAGSGSLAFGCWFKGPCSSPRDLKDNVSSYVTRTCEYSYMHQGHRHRVGTYAFDGSMTSNA